MSRYAIVVATFYQELADRLVVSATDAFKEAGAEDVDVYEVPGAFELPLAAKYCAESGRFIFGERLGDPLADKVLGFLRSAVAGLTRGEIFDKLSHNVARERITGALRKLAGFGQVRQEIVPTSGRPIERWHAIRRAGLKAFNESGVGGCVPAREREPGEELGQ